LRGGFLRVVFAAEVFAADVTRTRFVFGGEAAGSKSSSLLLYDSFSAFKFATRSSISGESIWLSSSSRTSTSFVALLESVIG
jgi:hypothetical protein